MFIMVKKQRFIDMYICISMNRKADVQMHLFFSSTSYSLYLFSLIVAPLSRFSICTFHILIFDR